MGVVLYLISQVLWVLYILSILVVVRHGYNIIQLLRDETTDSKYVLGKATLVWLGVAVAYIITGIINGIGL